MRQPPKPFRNLAPVLLCLSACASSSSIIPPELLTDPEAEVDQAWHRGPSVEVDANGPARWVPSLYEAFDTERAMKMIHFIDGFYRAPANPYYDEVLDRVAADLEAAGFGSDKRFELRFIEGEAHPSWTPRQAEIALLLPDEKPRTLHAFSAPGDADRTMLPINAPSCDLEGRVVLHLSEVEPGTVLVTDVPVSQVLDRARGSGAVAVISSSLGIYNIDTSGKERHLEAIQFRTVPPGTELPVFQISPRAYGQISSALEQAAEGGDEVRVHARAEVAFESRPLRTLVATVVGSSRPDEAVVMVSHVQEPGACDNASGVGGLLESARALVMLLEEEKVDWPARSVSFVWGDEFRQSRAWLDDTEREPIAGFSSDMTGQSKDTGAIALLERMPDPGALITLPPDAHTPWGAGNVTEEDLNPNGLAVIARCAMIDVGLIEGGWESADHPWEGGSDHDVFIERGIPAVLLWHFTDFTYHTSLDRMTFVDSQEVRRTGVALLGAALSVADPKPTDLDRYVRSLKLEENVRVAAAKDANNEDLEVMWKEWCFGAREWLRKQCLGTEEGIPAEKK